MVAELCVVVVPAGCFGLETRINLYAMETKCSAEDLEWTGSHGCRMCEDLHFKWCKRWAAEGFCSMGFRRRIIPIRTVPPDMVFVGAGEIAEIETTQVLDRPTQEPTETLVEERSVLFLFFIPRMFEK